MNRNDGQEFVVVGEEDINDFNEAGILPQSPEVLAKIQEWLQPTDYLADSSEYNKHLSSYVPGTDLWIEQTDAYRKWHDSPDHGSLWTKAIAGAGKSVFAAMTASKLAQIEKVPVLFFFFRQIVATNHDPHSMTRDWISMILHHSPPLQAKMKDYMDNRRTLDNITINELWQDLVQALQSVPKAYCIVDALDEMDNDKEEFFQSLVDLGKQRPASIKVLMTSRPLPRIEGRLKDPSILQVRLDQHSVDKDIAVYVDHRLNAHPNVNSELRSAVKHSIREKAQGSFLYTRLILDELLDHMKQMSPDIQYLQRSLDWLPASLEDMYNGMLLDHSLRSRVPQDLQLTILRWVTHSSRPLRLLELAAMLDSQDKSGNTGMDTKAIVRAACGPLLEILEDETVSVIHHSFTEFLTDAGRKRRVVPGTVHPQFPIIDPSEAHSSMSLASVNYLTRGCFDDWKLQDHGGDDEEDDDYHCHSSQRQPQHTIKMQHPFLDYAINNWYIHAGKLENPDVTLFSTLDKFLKSGNHSFSCWLEMVWNNTRRISKVTPLHVAAWAGVSTYAQHVLGRGDEANGLDGKWRTPLSWASVWILSP
jgi:hypothetical protein